MIEMDLYELVMKLIGPVQPVGEHHTDLMRLDNMGELIELTEQLLIEIEKAESHADRVEHSMKAIGERARGFLGRSERRIGGNMNQDSEGFTQSKLNPEIWIKFVKVPDENQRTVLEFIDHCNKVESLAKNFDKQIKLETIAENNLGRRLQPNENVDYEIAKGRILIKIFRRQ